MADPEQTVGYRSLLAARLERGGLLSANAEKLLSELPLRTRQFSAGEDVRAARQEPAECVVVLSGMMCGYTLLNDGLRQIVALHLAGDWPNIAALQLGRADHHVLALSRVEAALIPHAAVRDLLVRSPELAERFWHQALLESEISRMWLVGMGRRSASARLAHLFCEIAVRMDAASVPHRAGRYPLPMTQRDLADVTGLSVVHVNRSVQKLRKIGALELRSGELRILDPKLLADVGEFNASYLMGNHPQVAGLRSDRTWDIGSPEAGALAP